MTAYIALGSNLGDRLLMLQAAVKQLRAIYPGQRSSSVYETEPREYVTQPDFLNAVIAVETTSAPQSIVNSLLEIERNLGRDRSGPIVAKGPRLIDLDLLLLGEEISRDGNARVPHPHLHERMFVLEPLAEIAPGAMHPVLHKTILELRDERKMHPESGAVKLYAPPLF